MVGLGSDLIKFVTGNEIVDPIQHLTSNVNP